jgi:hypothetical protein
LFLSACSGYSKLSKNQKKWVRKHPFAALKVKKINQRTDVVYAYVKSKNLLDSFENGGKLDAYRHIYYMAMLAQKINPGKLRSLGEAHEEDNYLDYLKGKYENGEPPDSLSCVMDIFNNSVGIELVDDASKTLSPEALSKKCMDAIRSGQAWFFRRDEKGNYVNCHGTVIDMASYKGKWNIPKCLVQR